MSQPNKHDTQPPPSYERACHSEKDRAPRTLPSTIGLPLQNMTDETRAAMRQVVEQRNPHLVYCPTCRAFHAISSAQRTSRISIGGEKCMVDREAVPIGGGSALSWWQAHLFMRAHRLGIKDHTGLAEGLGWATKDDWKFYMHGRVVDERLFLKIEAVRTVRLDGADHGLRAAPLCGHQFPESATERLKGTVMDCLLQLATGESKGMVVRGRHYRCGVCPSEWQVSVRTAACGEGPGAYDVSVRRYSDLGRVEDPGEKQWTRLRKGAGCFPWPYTWMWQALEPVMGKFEGVEGGVVDARNIFYS